MSKIQKESNSQRQRIAAALVEVEGGIIRHVDLWNQNVEFIEEDEAWERPAVFVEFGEIVWRQYKGPEDGMWGDAEVLLHIVTDWKGSAAAGADTREATLSDYELPDRIHAAMLGLRGTTFRNVPLSQDLLVFAAASPPLTLSLWLPLRET